MSNSQRQAIIKLIEKKEKDRRYIFNWRPISLINVDAKIGSKSLATRVEGVLETVIHPDQCAYVKHRSTFDALRTIEDVFEFSKATHIPGLLVAIDFEKAFDSVNRDFLIKSLRAFGFGHDFVKWVKTYYCDISSCIMNNGFTNGYFVIEKGVRQGEPLSPLLFIIVIEILAIQVRDNKTIKGLAIGEQEIKLSIFADDLTALLKNKEAYTNLMKVLGKFSKCSGLRLNKSKTEAYWLGRYHKNPPSGLTGLKKVNEPRP